MSALPDPHAPHPLLQASLADVPGITASVAKALGRENLTTIAHLVAMLPFRHEDRRRMEGTAFVPSELPACHHVFVVRTSVKRYAMRSSFEAVVQHVNGPGLGQQLTLKWFNMPFMSRQIAEGQELVAHGKISEWKGILSMMHPEFEVVRGGEDEDGIGIHAGRITPVYRLRGTLVQKSLRAAMWHCLHYLPPDFLPDILPKPKAEGEFAGLSRSVAWRSANFPNSSEDLERARRYLALEEFYLYQLRVVRRRREHVAAGGRPLQGDGRLVNAFLHGLPFTLTDAQQRSVTEIHADMARAQPMNRLLHGDVGSGKTVVAFASMLAAVEAGTQAALMAPTQILAEQHAQNAKRWLEPLGLRVALRTGSKKDDGSSMALWQQSSASESAEAAPSAAAAPGDEAPAKPARKSAKRAAAEPGESESSAQSVRSAETAPPAPRLDRPDIIIGTHALLNEPAWLTDLGLAVIDEQHKFGVAQRARLIQHGRTPDVLVMTATPIPRTLTLTIYGDLDVSTIDVKPRAGVSLTTTVRTEKELAASTAFILSQIAEGRQAYIVFPLVEESDKAEAGAAKQGHEEWTRRLKPHAVGLLHGRMSNDDKDAAMKAFRSGETKALVSTTVIEVGVDVPNATVMLISDAGRFGLAQLHQLRGRVGRGTHDSHCLLHIDAKDDEAKERLAIMAETSDGFRIAEEDLRRRGPGNVLGHAQSGQAPLRFAEMLADTRLVRIARQLAERAFDEDPTLSKPQFLHLQAFVFEERQLPKAMLQ